MFAKLQQFIPSSAQFWIYSIVQIRRTSNLVLSQVLEMPTGCKELNYAPELNKPSVCQNTCPRFLPPDKSSRLRRYVVEAILSPSLAHYTHCRTYCLKKQRCGRASYSDTPASTPGSGTGYPTFSWILQTLQPNTVVVLYSRPRRLPSRRQAHNNTFLQHGISQDTNFILPSSQK